MAITVASDAAVIRQKIARQPKARSSRPPVSGDNICAIIMTAITRLSRALIWSRAYKSRTMARLITMPLAPPRAWKKRAAISCGRFSANTQATLAATISDMPASSTGRRPNLSDSAPMTICEQAMPTMYIDTVICASEIGLSKVFASTGSVGTSM